MKNILNVAFIAALVFCVHSCKKNNVSVDKDPPLSAPDNAEFVSNTKTFTTTYFVKSDGTPFAIPVGLTNVSNSDRTVGFTYTSKTASSPAQYSAPSSLTIKAGKALDSLRISGVYASYPIGRIDTMIVRIAGNIPGVYQRDSLLVVMRRYCDVVFSNLNGDYANAFDTDPTGTYGPYTATISGITSTGPTTATMTITNLAYAELGVPTAPVTVNIDFTDPAHFTTSIPTQVIYPGSYGPYGPVSITGTTVGSFSTCDNTFSFNYNLYVALGSFGDINTVFGR